MLHVPHVFLKLSHACVAPPALCVCSSPGSLCLEPVRLVSWLVPLTVLRVRRCKRLLCSSCALLSAYPCPHQVLELKGSIRVLCRVRPLLQKERANLETGSNGEPVLPVKVSS